MDFHERHSRLCRRKDERGQALAMAVVSMAAVLAMGALAVDLGMAFHPVEHLTVLANTGARGRTNGIGDVADDPRTPYLREGFILLHELPYQAYAKAGRFVPAYGLRLDDHTSFIRRRFH